MKQWKRRLPHRMVGWIAALWMVVSLALPARTLEPEPLCGLQAHEHGDVCSTVEERLSCKASAHIHGETCQNAEGTLICGLSDILLHTHGDHCHDREGNLVCPLPEVLPHSHEEACFQTEETGETVLICQQGHSHEEACYAEDSLICGLVEVPEHSHSEDCMETYSQLTCTQTEHIHEEACYIAEVPTEEPTTVPTETQIETIPEETIPEETIPEETIPEETSPPLLLFSVEPRAIHTAEKTEEDVATVYDPGIRFRLFDYSLDINKNYDKTDWRTISRYFTFRSSNLTSGETPSNEVPIPSPNINATHDADGFPAAHATVERVLQNGMPVLDLTRNADGTARSDPEIGADVRSLAYLFSDQGDPAVTAYSPGNTILQKSGTRYFYDSRTNAVDYDTSENQFRVRSYAERNSTTAGSGAGYGDFLPFNYTGGETIHDPETESVPYHLRTEDVNYWFGMTMEVDFYQSKDGLLGDEPMVFRFSGDDDVWVFVDDVLVLDLGGTHGTVDGSIDFATGQVLQYLSWNGANATEASRINGSSTSFPTTLRACFDAAGRTPEGGWEEDGNTFADYTKHTLKFFYLERGAAVANCKIDFSLPTLPDQSLTVTKELTGAEELRDFLSRQLAYQFRVVQPDGSLFLQPGTAYTLLENGVAAGTGTIDDDGIFSLYPGQSAQFTRMLEKGGGKTDYVVQEILPDQLTGQYSGVEYSVNGNGGTTKTEEGPEISFTAFETEQLSAEQSQLVTFQNRVDTSKLCTLRVTKAAKPETQLPADMTFPIQITLGGELLPVGSRYQIDNEILTVEEAGILPLKVGQTAVILEGILSGTDYFVTELGHQAAYSGTVSSGEDVTCTDQGAGGTFPLGGQVEITVTNAGLYQMPLTGGTGTKPYLWAGLLQTLAAVSLYEFLLKRPKGHFIKN